MSLETRYSHFSDVLFINFLNTMNNENNKPTDFLMEEGMVDRFLSLMEDKHLLHPLQVRRMKEEEISVPELQTFREESREFFLNNDASLTPFLEMLQEKTEQAPLSFLAAEGSLVALPKQGGTDGLLSVFAYTMLEAYEGGLFQKMKKCENPHCVSLFLDKKGKRKWCSMSLCGNRAKARKHYQKTK